MDWTIELAKSSGFCFGVQNAVTSAYSVIRDYPGRKIYMLGEITHNETVVGELLSSGMLLAHSPEEVEEGSVVVIRAHGVTPQVMEELQKLGVTNAIYMDMGAGWNYSWYRQASGKVLMLFGFPVPWSHNWVVFRK